MNDNILFTVYTRETLPGEYPSGLANSVHIKYSISDEEEGTLNNNYGILFASGEISKENTIIPMCAQNPKIFQIDDEWIGICAEKIFENGAPVEESADSLVLWKTKDLIHFEECGMIPADDVAKWNPTSSLLVEKEIGESAICYWSRIKSVSVSVPETVQAKSISDLENIKASIVYSDGSKTEKSISWDISESDFDKKEKHQIHGVIKRQAFDFPLAKGYGDPVVFKWDGKWYYLSTNDNLNDIGIYAREADSVEGLFDDNVTEHLILPFDPERGFEQTFWAPEFHVVGDDAYIFFAVSGHKWGPQCHLMKLKKGGCVISEKDWEDPVKVVRADGSPLTTDGITLDMTYIKTKKTSYVVWSYRKDINTDKDTGSMLYIATVNENEPWRLTCEPVLLSRPLYSWENLEGTINNEGPYSFIRDNKVYLTYSGGAANGFTYVLGLFTADIDSDLLDLNSWSKSITPVLSYYSVKGEYGPGHNSFFVNEDGELMIAYHAETAIDENLRCDGIRRVHFRRDNTPYFQMTAEEDLGEADRIVEITVMNIKYD